MSPAPTQITFGQEKVVCRAAIINCLHCQLNHGLFSQLKV